VSWSREKEKYTAILGELTGGEAPLAHTHPRVSDARGSNR